MGKDEHEMAFAVLKCWGLPKLAGKGGSFAQVARLVGGTTF
jgi:hypothetical protein